MPMKPHKDESQSEFMARCVPDMIGTGDNKRPRDQAVAICLDIWKNKAGPSMVLRGPSNTGELRKQDAPEPDPGEDYQDFMDRCLNETDDDEEACLMAWEDRSAQKVVHKIRETEPSRDEYTLSDESVDRMGDIISASGWHLDNFKRNPVALAFHRADFVIGRWRNLRVEKGELRGHLELAPAGTSDRIDEIRRLVEAGILKATSVGFRPIKHEAIDPKDPWGGTRFLEQELVETSLVSVPANPNALAVAKSLNISPETQALMFAGQGDKDMSTVRRGLNGGQARTSQVGKGGTMLAQHINDLQTRIRENCERLEDLYTKINNLNESDDNDSVIEKLNESIGKDRKKLAMLEQSELQLGKTTSKTNGSGNGSTALTVLHDIRNENKGRIDEPERERRQQYFRQPGEKELKPLDYAVRAAVATLASKLLGRSPEQFCKDYAPYSDEKTRTFVDWNMRAAVNPAMTTVSGWAAELVTQINADYMGLLQPQSVYPRLAAKGLSLTFGAAGRINIPMRSATPTIAGSFVGEGMPIPVRRGAFTSQVLTPKKLAVITSWTKEIDMHSVPAIEGLLREMISEDTTVAIDSVLLDNGAATVIRPAGLLNGVSGQTPTAITNGAFAAIIGDIKNLVGALVTSTKGNLRSLVFLMNPSDVLSASMIVPPNTGAMPFRDELARGTLLNIPVIDSFTVPAKTVILLDAADFVSVGADGPQFDISDTATIHEEDTSPQPIVGGTGAGTAANPVRSLWQTDTLALRMIQRLNWTMRRTGMVASVSAITW